MAISTINFMYWLTNYQMGDVSKALQGTSDPAGLESKWYYYILRLDMSGAQAMFKLFYEMSEDNQIIFTQWVEDNYNYQKID